VLQLTSNRVFVFVSPCDMRKSYDTLAALVRDAGLNPLSGDLYAFTNKGRNRFKILVWERGGYWLCAKRLEEGVFAVPVTEADGNLYTMEIGLTELRLIIDGIELRKIKKTHRYEQKGFQ
jgi:transposase